MAKPPLTLLDYEHAARTLGVDVATIRAVADVESRGSGFMADGHPKVLFERHVMYRRVKAKFGQRKADQLVQQFPDVINLSSGGYGTESAQPKRMDRAAALIDRDCALESASWGKFQIMGYHWAAMGYPTLQTFINAMYRSEAEHLKAFVQYILKVDPALLRAIKVKNWAEFARRYNGPGYAANRYDIKMAEAHKKYSAAA